MKNLSKTFIYTVAILAGAATALFLIINQSSEAATGTVTPSTTSSRPSEAAPATTGTVTPSTTSSRTSSQGQLAVGAAETISLSSPFKFESITDFILNIPQILSGFAGLIGLVFFAINAIKYLLGAGQEQSVTEAKQGLLFAAIGVGLAALTFTIISLVKTLITS